MTQAPRWGERDEAVLRAQAMGDDLAEIRASVERLDQGLETAFRREYPEGALPTQDRTEYRPRRVLGRLVVPMGAERQNAVLRRLRRF